MNSLKPQQVKHIHPFVTGGGGGAGKSDLIITLHLNLSGILHSVVHYQLFC